MSITESWGQERRRGIKYLRQDKWQTTTLAAERDDHESGVPDDWILCMQRATLEEL